MQIFSYLISEYGNFPSNGKIFLVSNGLDITPKKIKDIDYLNELTLDDVNIVIPPQDPLTIVLSVVLSFASTLLFTPKVPNAANRNIPEASPNNGLSTRTNEARLGARRPSILGTVNSVPDLLTLPYSVFDHLGREVEHSYMFVSEGRLFLTLATNY